MTKPILQVRKLRHTEASTARQASLPSPDHPFSSLLRILHPPASTESRGPGGHSAAGACSAPAAAAAPARGPRAAGRGLVLAMAKGEVEDVLPWGAGEPAVGVL